MNVYDQQGNVLDNYDLAAGRLVPYTYTIHHEAVEAVEEQGHWEDVAIYYDDSGTERGRDVIWVVDVPGVEARPAWDEAAEASIFVRYTAAELEAMQKPTAEQLLTAIMEGMTDERLSH